ncbi:MAG: sugar phosphate nucleotidyltransferase [Candidatus Micrarchaeota archaeon]
MCGIGKGMPKRVAILCGGEGTRLREETATKPKPMIMIGQKPLLWHIMKYYSSFGCDEFILCLGYKGEVIREHFSRYPEPGWKITFAETGIRTQTGARIKRIEGHTGGERFFATYGDGLSDVDLASLNGFHAQRGSVATLTATRPRSRWGFLQADKSGLVTLFKEKPVMEEYVNGGFFVFENDIFDFLDDSEGFVLETEGFSRLIGKKQLSMYPHPGFWFAVDTYKEYVELGDLWGKGAAPWKRW